MRKFLQILLLTIPLLSIGRGYNSVNKKELLSSSSLSAKSESTKIAVNPVIQFEKSTDIISEASGVLPGEAPMDCIPYFDHKVKILIDAAPTVPITVSVGLTFAPDDAPPAEEGVDYAFVSTEVTFDDAVLEREVTLRIYNDAIEEIDKIIALNLAIITEDAADLGAINNQYITLSDDDKITPITNELFSEDFSTMAVGSIPAGWSLTSAVDPEVHWEVANYGASPNWEHPNLYIRNLAGSEPYYAVVGIETPTFDATGYSALDLTFNQALYGDETTAGTGQIEVWDGSAWNVVHSEENSLGGSELQQVNVHISIPIEYANANMKLRFTLNSFTFAIWVLDDIRITGDMFPSPIAEEISIKPDIQNLGPNATAYFLDRATNSILAKVKNLTSHDYGCTSVEIDRAGEGSAEWLGAYNISNKTLKITPSNPNPAGAYEITLYYSAAELGDFISGVTTMGKSEGGIGNGDANASTVSAVTVSPYNDGFAFTASFTTGFSGFGMSDAPPGSSLPVKLVRFEGKNTAEGNHLTWQTTQEINNDYFLIERSSDARNFQNIGKVMGISMAAELNDYSYTDSGYGNGLSYYRIRQVDKDGKYAISEMIAIDNNTTMSMYPNPVKDVASFPIGGTSAKLADLRVVNLSGKTVLQKKNIKAQNGLIQQNLNSLSSGTYHVVLTTSENKYQYKFIKQ